MKNRRILRQEIAKRPRIRLGLILLDLAEQTSLGPGGGPQIRPLGLVELLEAGLADNAVGAGALVDAGDDEGFGRGGEGRRWSFGAVVRVMEAEGEG